jgi:ABC-2 type transport system ATP-binding protein
MDEARYLADRVCIIDRGKKIAEGSPEDLINSCGGGNTLVIRGCDQAATERLTEALPYSEASGNDILVRLPEGDGIAEISRAAQIIRDGGFRCEEIYVKKPTLEDVFLNLTGGAKPEN